MWVVLCWRCALAIWSFDGNPEISVSIREILPDEGTASPTGHVPMRSLAS